jgi:hypothetical protein
LRCRCMRPAQGGTRHKKAKARRAGLGGGGRLWRRKKRSWHRDGSNISPAHLNARSTKTRQPALHNGPDQPAQPFDVVGELPGTVRRASAHFFAARLLGVGPMDMVLNRVEGFLCSV